MTGVSLRVFHDDGLELSDDEVAALIDEAIANDAYDDAVCSGQAELGGGCIGENHIETCPVLIAWQDRKEASTKRRGMR